MQPSTIFQMVLPLRQQLDTADIFTGANFVSTTDKMDEP